MNQESLSRSDLEEGLNKNPKQLPVSCLYDKRGSDLYEDITALPDYYPFNEESALLKTSVQQIISHIAPGSIIVELGCGSAAKTGTILNALAKRDSSSQLHFVGIDVSQQALDLASASLLQHCPLLLPSNVDLICADYLDGLKAARARYPEAHLCILWLGSSVGNLSPAETLKFFANLSEICGPKSQVLLCTDLWKDEKVLHAAYHDSQGVTEAFIKNGMVNALTTLGVPSASALVANWQYIVKVNQEEQQVEMWLHATSPAVNGKPLVVGGEAILMEVSRKFTMGGIRSLAYRSGWFIQQAWSSGKYGIHMMLPQLEAVKRCQADTDAFFSAIPDWQEHPIDVRHPFAFYYGHIAAFANIKAFPEEPVSSLQTLFSRGIDLDLADTSRCCNSHPDIPSEWPSPEETRKFVKQMRSKYLEALDRRAISDRMVWMNLEHERMHLETLSYMRAQAVKKAFNSRAAAEANGFHSSSEDKGTEGRAESGQMVSVSAGKVVLGVDMDNSVDFVWDNEGPAGSPISVASFKVACKPCTVRQFHDFVFQQQGYQTSKWWDPVDLHILQKRGQHMPATWSCASASDSDGESAFVHKPEGSFHWRQVAEEPVLLSLAEAQAFATSRACRIMTEPEYHRILQDPSSASRVKQMRGGGWEWTSTEFQPFPGFKPMPEYPEYSADFFDGKHFVLKGAAPSTHPSLVRDGFRNFYQKGYPYVQAKFRLCRD